VAAPGFDGKARTRVFRAGVLEAEQVPLAAVSQWLEGTDTVLWIDLCSPSVQQLQELAAELSLHELAVEDAIEPHQRPKLDHYESHLFVTCHALRIERASGRLESSEIDAFIHERWLVTVRKDETFPIEDAMHRCARTPHLTIHGAGFLLHALVDAVVDGYFDAIQVFDDYYDEVSDAVFSERPMEPAGQRYWFDMRRSLMRLHRMAAPIREVVSALMRSERGIVPEALTPYYQDVYDHALRVIESTEVLRDLVASLVETNITLRDYRQNQIMKKVTSWAAIIAVPAVITGYYGMNVPFPGAGEPSGVISSTILIAVLSVALYLLFKRREWL
jgi:magnesium transporter